MHTVPCTEDETAAREAIAAAYPPASLIFDGVRPVVIFATARMGRLFLANLRKAGVPVAAFADNDKNKWGTEIDGIPVLDADSLLKHYQDAPIVVASLLAENEIFHDLKRRGFVNVYPVSYLHYLKPELFESPILDGLFESCFDPALQEGIAAAAELWSDDESGQVYRRVLEYRRTLSMDIYPRLSADHPQYFPPEIIGFTPDDILLDGGAYTGDTLRIFRELHPDARNTYYGFEPDPQNYVSLQHEGQHYAGRLIAVNAGLGADEGVLGFMSNATVDSAFTTGEANMIVQVHTLDSYFATGDCPTFIKMDIEGMELQALLGGEQVIRRQRPKLAICVYHLPQHLWEIPLLLHTWIPDYRFYLRHYSTNMTETVLYAV